ncbi:SDR family NAD(P)-dependent oxidoreductase [Rhizobium mongolense]|uniref:NAD(P)-dependent dehydrogenase (Short-subunit alcohol dehydrogenase family) n=2 Tax=Rhizobium mongolense TaxID=57676 RepID=A0ABR6IFT9_9HYPH|nr:SDR family oxidoreductase [Rhizobium mongolense]MBB4226724.1 NAD(P)-dependent dehydrogenase (short-subunit alcohol dehydrogenase family) [Rhizobium mongolense]TVZ73956.1 NAD(P)-dependent dehydrogenase (short-subunit alcohol dehydrogenase family) [Rhizobium mongolense USDA 1844]
MGRLNGKVAIVAGAGRGIGRATAKLFAAEGAKVVVVSLTPANVDTVVAEIRSVGGTALGAACDLGDGDQIKAVASNVVETYGGIDILVNVAFDNSAVRSAVIDVSVEQLQRNFDTGPIAYLRMMQACYPYLKASGEGRVINFASLAGVLGLPPYGPYNLAKEAVRALTRTAAREWGPDGITVNTVLPVLMETAGFFLLSSGVWHLPRSRTADPKSARMVQPQSSRFAGPSDQIKSEPYVH